MSTYDNPIAKLREVFQIDCSDLDFDIYRIFYARPAEIEHYLNVRLRERVDATLASAATAKIEAPKARLVEAEKQSRDPGDESGCLPAARELRRRIAEATACGAKHNATASSRSC